MTPRFQSFLIIQTAFIGDVILATGLIEKLHQHDPDAAIDFLVRRGNEDLLLGHPHLRAVLTWDKKKGKLANLLALIGRVRRRRYDVVVNVHRYMSSGLITAASGATFTVGFDRNPLSFLFSRTVPHQLDGRHEVARNQTLISAITDANYSRPRLYPTTAQWTRVIGYKDVPYVCIAPTSVWFTKQLPPEKWVALLRTLPEGIRQVYLLGAPGDHAICDSIRQAAGSVAVTNLAGELGLLESAALMKDAVMNFVNDSAPMHLATALNAPVTAVFCSTTPRFGFGPLSDRSVVVETKISLDCRPCGLHGFKSCPRGHFRCADSIDVDDLVSALKAS